MKLGWNEVSVVEHMVNIHPARDVSSLCVPTGSDVRLTRIDEDAIRLLVDSFYDKVRADAELSPIFAEAVRGDWEPHLAKMRDFWSSVMLTTGRYKGNPVAAHLDIERMKAPLFDRWLELFGDTCTELFDAGIAELFRIKATRIAESLKLTLFYRPKRPPIGR